MALKLPEVGQPMLLRLPVFKIPPLLPALTIVTLGGGLIPLAKPVDRTFCVLCITKDLLDPELPRVSTFFSITDELHALSIISLVVEILSKSEATVTTVLFGELVCTDGLTDVTLNDTPDVTVLRFTMFLETIALCRMFPVGKDLEQTLTY